MLNTMLSIIVKPSFNMMYLRYRLNKLYLTLDLVWLSVRTTTIDAHIHLMNVQFNTGMGTWHWLNIGFSRCIQFSFSMTCFDL